MRKLLTHCPYCRAEFYVDAEDEEREKLEVECPYCSFQYKDKVEKTRIRHIKYNWELYDRIYSEYLESEDKSSHLKIASFMLLGTLTLFALGIVSMFFVDGFALQQKGIGLAGSVFSVFIVLGILNSYKGASFVLSFTAAIFSLLNSAIWGYLNSVAGFLMLSSDLSAPYVFFALVLSFVSLTLIVKNRHHFDSGY